MDVGRAETIGAAGGWGRESAVAAGTRMVRVRLGGGWLVVEQRAGWDCCWCWWRWTTRRGCRDTTGECVGQVAIDAGTAFMTGSYIKQSSFGT